MQPGGTFSLNATTNPRDAAHGYVEAGIIEDGHPARGVGGGVSQVATTLYNASYFAGMTNVEHKEHSFYISRYPAGREATVFDNLIDLKFRNDNPTAIMIQTVWTPSSITVRIYGTKRYDVTSATGPAHQPDRAQDRDDPRGREVRAQQGRSRVHGHRHPHAEGDQHGSGAHGDPDGALQPVADHRMWR